jgi:hypothetical protein
MYSRYRSIRAHSPAYLLLHHFLHSTLLYYAVLYCIGLCFTMLFYIVLDSALLCCSILYCVMLLQISTRKTCAACRLKTQSSWARTIGYAALLCRLFYVFSSIGFSTFYNMLSRSASHVCTITMLHDTSTALHCTHSSHALHRT